MANSPRIRAAKQTDAEEITRLCIELGYTVTSAEIADRLSILLGSDRHLITVAPGSGSGLLGWIVAEHRLLLESGERVEIVGLVVDQSARRKGIGRALVSAVEEWTASISLSTIFVRSNIARADSHKFYDSIGYVRSKTQHAYARQLHSAL